MPKDKGPLANWLDAIKEMDYAPATGLECFDAGDGLVLVKVTLSAGEPILVCFDDLPAVIDELSGGTIEGGGRVFRSDNDLDGTPTMTRPAQITLPPIAAAAVGYVGQPEEKTCR